MALSARTRFRVFNRDSFTCQYCGRRAPEVRLEVDHIHPRSCHGSDDFDNLITACRECNRGKGPFHAHGRNRITHAEALRRRETELLQRADTKFRAIVEDLIRPWEPGALYEDTPDLDPEIMLVLLRRGLTWHDIEQALGAVQRYRRRRYATVERLLNVFYDNCVYRLHGSDY